MNEQLPDKEHLPDNEHLIVLLSGQSRVPILDAMESAVGQEPDVADILSVRKLLPKDLVPFSGILLDVVLGTRKARRLGKAIDGWWYTTLGAEQGTHPVIASHHAKRFEGCAHVLEVCTGNGIDTHALAQVAQFVTTCESDAVTAALATGNLKASGIENVVVLCAAVDEHISLPAFDGLWADPSRRRRDGRRTTSTKEYSPLLETLHTISARNAHAVVGIKCGPGDSIPHALTSIYSSEFVGFNSECRERVLWRNADDGRLVVSLPQVHKHWAPSATDDAVGAPASSTLSAAHTTSPLQGDILVEPHAALIASGALSAFFREHGLRPIHEKIAYGIGRRSTTDLDVLRDWADLFEIINVDTGVSGKRIRQHIHELGWNYRTEFKKRGWNGEPEELRENLTFPESEAFGVVIIARIERAHLTLYCKRINA